MADDYSRIQQADEEKYVPYNNQHKKNLPRWK